MKKELRKEAAQLLRAAAQALRKLGEDRGLSKNSRVVINLSNLRKLNGNSGKSA